MRPASVVLCVSFLVSSSLSRGAEPQRASNPSNPTARQTVPGTDPKTLNLAGPWFVQLDPEDKGLTDGWAQRAFAGPTMPLPGTTDQAKLGYRLDRKTMTYPVPFLHTRFPKGRLTERIDQRGFLVRPYMYIGPAWYQREVTVPESWRGKTVTLHLERVLWESRAWVDGRPLGRRDSLATPHRYELGVLTPGRHRLTLRVDNRMVYNIGTLSHSYGPETQSRWNGVVGAVRLEARAQVHVRHVDVYPAPNRRSARVRLELANEHERPVTVKVTCEVVDPQSSQRLGTASSRLELKPGSTELEQTVVLSQPAEPWDEFHPKLYQLRTELKTVDDRLDETDTSACLFGFRDVRRQGRHILVNGRRVFLRGTLDCAVYPKTGHPPTSLDQWLRVLKTIQRYGFNHVRYHTWCPPEAAFEAADRLGVYLQVETCFWIDDWTTSVDPTLKGLGRDPAVAEFVRKEVDRIVRCYGNHPSFLILCVGNEFGSRSTDWDFVDRLLGDVKRKDPRRLYVGCTARKRLTNDDLRVTHRTDRSTRGMGGPRTDWDFSQAAQATDLPVIAHETGQRPVYPDFPELLPKFTGPLSPDNFRRHWQTAQANGLAEQVKDFERASQLHQLVQYKAEHEAMLRTAEYAGYQLLMLNDFTGQSEAPVGILDPFWESKGVVDERAVRQWNSPTVLLARFPSFAWTTDQTFVADVEVAHYGPEPLRAARVQWRLLSRDGRRLASGVLPAVDLPCGALTRVGRVEQSLRQVQAPALVLFELQLGQQTNQWKLAVYEPPSGNESVPRHVLVTTRFDETTLRRLERGAKVLYLCHRLKNAHTGPSRFASQYWTAGWWGNRFSTLGVLCDPDHPALARFPTDGHSDWFWYDVLQSGVLVDLTDVLPHGYRPIVQAVSDFHYNRLLAGVFEVRVGRGKLLVCGFDLESNLAARHAARQLRHSLLSYVASDAFSPSTVLRPDQARDLLTPAASSKR